MRTTLTHTLPPSHAKHRSSKDRERTPRSAERERRRESRESVDGDGRRTSTRTSTRASARSPAESSARDRGSSVTTVVLLG